MFHRIPSSSAGSHPQSSTTDLASAHEVGTSGTSLETTLSPLSTRWNGSESSPTIAPRRAVVPAPAPVAASTSSSSSVVPAGPIVPPLTTPLNAQDAAVIDAALNSNPARWRRMQSQGNSRNRTISFETDVNGLGILANWLGVNITITNGLLSRCSAQVPGQLGQVHATYDISATAPQGRHLLLPRALAQAHERLPRHQTLTFGLSERNAELLHRLLDEMPNGLVTVTQGAQAETLHAVIDLPDPDSSLLVDRYHVTVQTQGGRIVQAQVCSERPDGHPGPPILTAPLQAHRNAQGVLTVANPLNVHLEMQEPGTGACPSHSVNHAFQATVVPPTALTNATLDQTAAQIGQLGQAQMIFQFDADYTGHNPALEALLTNGEFAVFELGSQELGQGMAGAHQITLLGPNQNASGQWVVFESGIPSGHEGPSALPFANVQQALQHIGNRSAPYNGGRRLLVLYAAATPLQPPAAVATGANVDAGAEADAAADTNASSTLDTSLGAPRDATPTSTPTPNATASASLTVSNRAEANTSTSTESTSAPRSATSAGHSSSSTARRRTASDYPPPRQLRSIRPRPTFEANPRPLPGSEATDTGERQRPSRTGSDRDRARERVIVQARARLAAQPPTSSANHSTAGRSTQRPTIDANYWARQTANPQPFVSTRLPQPANRAFIELATRHGMTVQRQMDDWDRVGLTRFMQFLALHGTTVIEQVQQGTLREALTASYAAGVDSRVAPSLERIFGLQNVPGVRRRQAPARNDQGSAEMRRRIGLAAATRLQELGADPTSRPYYWANVIVNGGPQLPASRGSHPNAPQEPSHQRLLDGLPEGAVQSDVRQVRRFMCFLESHNTTWDAERTQGSLTDAARAAVHAGMTVNLVGCLNRTLGQNVGSLMHGR